MAGFNGIDKKLFEICKRTDPKHETVAQYADYLESRKINAFSYFRMADGERIRRYTSAGAIAPYISFARGVGLLNDTNQVTRPEKVMSVDVFTSWCGDCVLEYLSDTATPIKAVRQAVRQMLNVNPPPAHIPTLDRLSTSLPVRSTLAFKNCIRLLAILRPEVIELKSTQVLTIKGLLED